MTKNNVPKSPPLPINNIIQHTESHNISTKKDKMVNRLILDSKIPTSFKEMLNTNLNNALRLKIINLNVTFLYR
ncbi:MAG: hypothetical protein AB8U25_07535 [Rickettsiales endosymbiont of Dermacentor nuttalli]